MKNEILTGYCPGCGNVSRLPIYFHNAEQTLRVCGVVCWAENFARIFGSLYDLKATIAGNVEGRFLLEFTGDDFARAERDRRAGHVKQPTTFAGYGGKFCDKCFTGSDTHDIACPNRFERIPIEGTYKDGETFTVELPEVNATAERSSTWKPGGEAFPTTADFLTGCPGCGHDEPDHANGCPSLVALFTPRKPARAIPNGFDGPPQQFVISVETYRAVQAVANRWNNPQPVPSHDELSLESSVKKLAEIFKND